MTPSLFAHIYLSICVCVGAAEDHYGGTNTNTGGKWGSASPGPGTGECHMYPIYLYLILFSVPCHVTTILTKLYNHTNNNMSIYIFLNNTA